MDKSRHEIFDEAQESLEKVVRRMIKYADRHRRPLEFQVGGPCSLKTNIVDVEENQ